MTDVSINAGWDDDAEVADLVSRTPTLQNDVIIPTHEVEDLPEVDEETKMIASANDALESLLYVVEDIKKSQGMSQTIATEALKYMENFDGNRPLAYYSKTPTATRLKPGLESISAGVWALIAAAVTAATLIIHKIIKWLLGLKNNPTSNGDALGKEIAKKSAEDEKNLANLHEGISKISDQLLSLDKALNKGVSVVAPEGHSYEVRGVEQLARMVTESGPDADAAADIFSGADPFFYDLVTNGEYSLIVKKTIAAAATIGEVLAIKMEIIRGIVNDSQNPTITQTLANKDKIADLVKPIMLNIHGKEDTVSAISAALAEQREKTAESKPKAAVSVIDVVRRVTNMLGHGDPVHQIIEINTGVGVKLAEMNQLLVGLKAVATELNAGKFQIDPDTLIQTGTDIRIAIETVQTDVLDLAAMLKQFEHYRIICVNLTERVVMFVEQLSRKMELATVDTALPSLKKEISMLMRLSEDTRKRQVEYYRRFITGAL